MDQLTGNSSEKLFWLGQGKHYLYSQGWLLTRYAMICSIQFVSSNKWKTRAHWGNSEITGRGLLAIAGQGSIYQVILDAGEEYIVHPRYTRFLGPSIIAILLNYQL